LIHWHQIKISKRYRHPIGVNSIYQSLVAEINASSSAGLTAKVSGAVSIFPINYVADLVYDSDDADWPFSGTAVSGANEICVRVGPEFPFVEVCP
jgi:hypothetical protein